MCVGEKIGTTLVAPKYKAWKKLSISVRMSHRCCAYVGEEWGEEGEDSIYLIIKEWRYTLTLCLWGLQSLTQSRDVSIILLNFDDCLGTSELHEWAQLQKWAAEVPSLISLVLGVKIAVPHVPHGGGVLLHSLIWSAVKSVFRNRGTGTVAH